MTTDPLKRILDRDFSNVQVKEDIKKSSELLREIVNYSTNLYARCIESSERSEEDSVIFNLFHHMIEITDGIEVLLSQSCIKSSIPLLRSLFESLLYIEYILKNEELFEKRARSWLYFCCLDRIEFNSNLDLSTNTGIKFEKALQNDKLLKNIQPEVQNKAKERIKKTNKYLSSPIMHEIEIEYKRLKKKAGRVKWYQLFSDNDPEDKKDLGLKNLYELSKYLNREADYLFHYSDWSSTLHCYSLDSYQAKNGKIFIKRMRNPVTIKFKEATNYAAQFLLDAIKVIMGKYRPDENIQIWYEQEIDDKFPLK